MPDNENGGTNGGNQIEQLRQEASQQSIDELAQELRRLMERARFVEDAVRRRAGRLTGNTSDVDSEQGRAEEVKKSVIKTILAVTDESRAAEVSGQVSDFAAGIIRNISEHVRLESISQENAPALYRLLEKTLAGDITDVAGLVREFHDSGIEQYSPAMAVQVKDSLREFASTRVTQGEVDRLLPTSDTGDQPESPNSGENLSQEEQDRLTPAQRAVANRFTEEQARLLAEFNQEWSQGYSQYFSADELTKASVRKFYFKEEFVAWSKIETIRQLEKIRRQAGQLGENEFLMDEGVEDRLNQDIPDFFGVEETVNPIMDRLANNISSVERREISEHLQKEIVGTFSTIYQTIADKSPKESFEQHEQKGYWTAQVHVFDKLNKRFDQVIESSEGEFGQFKFLIPAYNKKIYRQLISVKDREGRNIEKEIFPTRTTAGTEEVDFQEFMRRTNYLAEHMKTTLRYLYNIKTLSLKTPDVEKTGGYWEQMKQYTDEMETTDIDLIMRLPGSDMFMSAHQMYVNYVQESFARSNWTHEASTFSRGLQNVFSEVEEKVLADLRTLYPDAKDSERRMAVVLGTGISRGVMFTETESAAWADPSWSLIDQTRTTKSYYTTDAAALMALNPIHAMGFKVKFVGWSQLLFLPVSMGHKDQISTNDKGGLKGYFNKVVWDHKKLWDKAKEYKNAYQQGSDAYNKVKGDEVLFVDLLPNISRVGGIHTKHGWRSTTAYEGHMVYKGERLDDPEGPTHGQKLDYLQSWKALEGIGFEMLYDFADMKMINVKNGEILSGASKAEKDAFFEYVYNKYLRKEGSTGTFQDEINKMVGDMSKGEGSVRETVDRLHDEGKLYLEIPLKEAYEQEAYHRLLHRALAGVLRQRLPAKFILLERGRMSKDGEYAWRKLRADTHLSAEDFSRAEADISLVQTYNRREMSRRMSDYLGAEGNRLADMEINDYVVNADVIRSVLTRLGKDPTNALKLYASLQRHYLDNPEQINRYGEYLRRKDVRGKDKEVRVFPFQIASEEVANEFLVYSEAGPKVLWRLAFDNNIAERGVTDTIGGWLKILVGEASHAPEQDLSEMMKALKNMQRQLAETDTTEYGYNVSHMLGQLAISFYRKDTLSRNLLTKFFKLGEKHSIAAEAFGSSNSRHVKEWEVMDIRNFIFEMEKAKAITKDGRGFEHEPHEIEVPIEVRIPFTNKRISLGKKKIIRPDYDYTSQDLFERGGATYKHVIYEMMNKYLPMASIVALLIYLNKAYKEAAGEEDRRH